MPNTRPIMLSAKDKKRFWSKVQKGQGKNACWMWTGATDENGYGFFKLANGGANGIQTKAHRVAYVIYHGQIPSNTCVLHECDTPGCVKRAHLFTGTLADNSKDMVKKDRHHRGDRHYAAQVTDTQAALIYQAVVTGESRNKIAKHYGVGRHVVDQIAVAGTWKHLGHTSLARPNMKGSNNPKAKLTTAKVRSIRKKRQQGALQRELAEEFGVTTGMIGHICRRMCWTEVNP